MAESYRRCIGCRQLAPKSALWRIVRTHPSGEVRLDSGMGRSAYLCPQRPCLQAARRKKRLARALKAPVPERIDRALEQRLAAREATEQNRQPAPDGEDASLA
jgi:predicted RNA-binding protein YlxR (DUF448 family)